MSARVQTGPRGGTYTVTSTGSKRYISARARGPNTPNAPNTRSVRVDGPHAYYRYKLGTGATLHMFGEFHAVSDRCQPCQPPTCVTISSLLQRMFEASTRAKQRMDLFLEQAYADPGKKYDNDAESHLLNVRDAYGHRRTEYGRVHRMNMRDHRNANVQNRTTNLHPVITDLYAERIVTNENAVPEVGMHLARIFLESDSFEKDIREALRFDTYGLTWRNSTRHNGKSVSRVRKQLLKLPAKLRQSLIQSVYALFKQAKYSHRLLAMFLMDAAQAARMLFYAGHGSGSPSKVLVSYGGSWHTHSMAVLLDRAIASGSLDGVCEVSGRNQIKWNVPCLSVRMPRNYGFT